MATAPSATPIYDQNISASSLLCPAPMCAFIHAKCKLTYFHTEGRRYAPALLEGGGGVCRVYNTSYFQAGTAEICSLLYFYSISYFHNTKYIQEQLSRCCVPLFGQHFADKVLEENFAWIKIQWKLFLANFVECRIKFATQFVKEENIWAFSAKSCLIAMNISKIILKFADVTSSILFGQECIPAACPVKLGVF